MTSKRAWSANARPVGEHQIIRPGGGTPFVVLGERIILRLDMSVVLQVEARTGQFVSLSAGGNRPYSELRFTAFASRV